MDVALEREELDIICEALQKLEAHAGDNEPDEERLKNIRKLYQRLQTLHTVR